MTVRTRCSKCQLTRDPSQFDVGSHRCVFCFKGRSCTVCKRFVDLNVLQQLGEFTSPFICQGCHVKIRDDHAQESWAIKTIELLDYVENVGKKVVAHGTIANFARKLDKESHVLVYTTPKLILQRNDALAKFPGLQGAHFLGSLSHEYRVTREIKIGPLSAHVSFMKKWGTSWNGTPLVRWKEDKAPWDGDEPYYTFDMIGGIVVWATREVGLTKNHLQTYVDRKEIVSAVREIVA